MLERVDENSPPEPKKAVQSLKNMTNFVVSKAKDVKNQIKEQRTNSPQKKIVEEEPFRFRLTPIQKEHSKTYVLSFPTANELKDWSDTMKRAKNALSTPTSSVRTDLSIFFCSNLLFFFSWW